MCSVPEPTTASARANAPASSPPTTAARVGPIVVVAAEAMAAVSPLATETIFDARTPPWAPAPCTKTPLPASVGPNCADGLRSSGDPAVIEASPSILPSPRAPKALTSTTAAEGVDAGGRAGGRRVAGGGATAGGVVVVAAFVCLAAGGEDRSRGTAGWFLESLLSTAMRPDTPTASAAVVRSCQRVPRLTRNDITPDDLDPIRQSSPGPSDWEAKASGCI